LKLGKRLEQLKSMVAIQYDHIWDCCCDHGLLGAALVAQQAAPHIHFVDVVPELMLQLQRKLIRFFPQNECTQSQWHVHCEDVASLPLQKYKGKHLIIIAGVGGNLMSELVKNICEQNPSLDMDFLLCPVLHQYALRQQLIALNLGLKSEVLIVDRKRYFEILLVSNQENIESKISPVGSLLWQAHTAEQFKISAGYLHKTLTHYRKVQLSDQLDVQPIIDAYSTVKL
jgi:tRNA (adenine22-N1)-methyltransferase